jgi:hypothetical protein
MSHADDGTLYRQWVDLISQLQAYAAERGLRLDKEADFTGFVYRMERQYDLPTTVQTVSLSLPDGKPVIVASVSPPQEPMKSIHLRLLGGHQTWHLHAAERGLTDGKIPFTTQRLYGILDRVFAVRAEAAPARP